MKIQKLVFIGLLFGLLVVGSAVFAMVETSMGPEFEKQQMLEKEKMAQAMSEEKGILQGEDREQVRGMPVYGLKLSDNAKKFIEEIIDSKEKYSEVIAKKTGITPEDIHQVIDFFYQQQPKMSYSDVKGLKLLKKAVPGAQVPVDYSDIIKDLVMLRSDLNIEREFPAFVSYFDEKSIEELLTKRSDINAEFLGNYLEKELLHLRPDYGFIMGKFLPKFLVLLSKRPDLKAEALGKILELAYEKYLGERFYGAILKELLVKRPDAKTARLSEILLAVAKDMNNFPLVKEVLSKQPNLSADELGLFVQMIVQHANTSMSMQWPNVKEFVKEILAKRKDLKLEHIVKILKQAIMFDDLAVLRDVLALRSDLSTEDIAKVLKSAVKRIGKVRAQNSLAIIKELLTLGKDIKEDTILKLLKIAAGQSDFETLKEILALRPTTKIEGELIQKVAQAGKLDLVRQLLEKRPDLKEEDYISITDEFKAAVKSNDAMTVKELLPKIMEIKLEDIVALLSNSFYTFWPQQVDLFKEVLTKRADLTIDDYGKILEGMVQYVELVKVVLEKRPDMERESMVAALELAARGDYVASLKELLAKRSDLTAEDRENAFLLAVENGSEAVALELFLTIRKTDAKKAQALLTKAIDNVDKIDNMPEYQKESIKDFLYSLKHGGRSVFVSYEQATK